MRGRHLGLVVMNADGSAGLDVTLRARLAPAWLAPTSTGLLILGTAMLLLALLTLAWPQARHDPILAAVPDELALPPMPAVALRFTWPPIALPAVPPVIGDRDDRVDVPV